MKKHTFNLSANIENGWETGTGYIATPNAKRATAAIVSGFQSGIHSFTVIGTYGTGKSSFLLALEHDLNAANKRKLLLDNPKVLGGAKEFDMLNIVGDYAELSTLLARKLGVEGCQTNVLEPYAQAEVMMNVANLLKPKGTAYYAVRRDLAEEGFRLHAIHKQYTYQCNVRLPFTSLVCNKSFELYKYNHFNKLPRREGERCPFCRLSRRVEIICETATCVAFYDGYPVSPGHALIIPKRHVASYFDLTNHEREAMNVMLQYVRQKIDERFHPDGYNVGINVGEAAGQSVFHVHMHLIPRYKGDVESPKGGVRGVIPKKQKYSFSDPITMPPTEKSPKAYTVEEKRKEHGNAYRSWDGEADALLCRLYDECNDTGTLSEKFGRTKGAIESRLRKLGKMG